MNAAGYLIKAPPQRVAIGDRMVAVERSFYDGEHIASGAPVFVWFTESKGGSGLAFGGTVYGVTALGEVHSKRQRVELSVEQMASGLGDADLAPYRDVRTSEPVSTLAFKLFRHEHDKICALTRPEFTFLCSYLETHA